MFPINMNDRNVENVGESVLKYINHDRFASSNIMCTLPS